MKNTPGEQCLQRLNSQNQITLYQEILDDLELEEGDMVFLEKNSAGRWELWVEDEAMTVLREAWDDIDGITRSKGQEFCAAKSIPEMKLGATQEELLEAALDTIWDTILRCRQYDIYPTKHDCRMALGLS